MIICRKVEHEDYNELIFEYKEGENMLNTECKQCHKKWHHDNSKYCSMCGNKLVDEPEFKVGDYVTDTSDDDPFICKIEKIVGNDVSGKWYCVSKKYFDRLVGLPISDSRLSTPEEIAEYESALQFHNHGRKPFEIKEGDLLEDTLEKFFAKSDYYDKKVLISKGLKFLKTAEEVNEWLGVSDE